MKRKPNEEPQLIFHGCIVDLDKPGPHKLTREQEKELAGIIYHFFRKYRDGLLPDQIDCKVLPEKLSSLPKQRRPGSKKKTAER